MGQERLASAVAVHTGKGTVWCNAGQCPPPEVAALIANPDAWEGGICPVLGDETGQAQEAEADQDQPPRRGPGGSREAWADYARKKGVIVEQAWTRDQIIEAYEASLAR